MEKKNFKIKRKEFKEKNDEYAIIATHLERIKSYRVKADYKPKFTGSRPSFAAHLTLKYSQAIITSINDLNK